MTGNRFSLDKRARLKDVELPLMWSMAVRRMVGWGVDDWSVGSSHRTEMRCNGWTECQLCYTQMSSR